MKKLMGVVALALSFALVVTGCDSTKMTRIGVIQYVQHPALDASYDGFVDGLSERGFKNGENIKIDFQNASGEQSNCVTIASKLVNDKDDLILAIATPAALAVANTTSTIPILITAVTDPQSSNLVKSNALPEVNVSGTSDLTPVQSQIDLIKTLVPSAKTVGLMYCSSEENSVFQIDLAKAECDRIGLKYVIATVSNTNEVQQVTQNLVGRVDAIYIPTDNMLASSMALVGEVTTAAKIPVICGEEGMVQQGGLATFGINYYELGKLTGYMAADILEGKKKVENMPIQYLDHFDFTYNEDTLKALGLTLPEDLVK